MTIRLYMFDSGKVAAARQGRDRGEEGAVWDLLDAVLAAPSIALDAERSSRAQPRPIERLHDRRIGIMRKVAKEQGLRVIFEDGDSILVESPAGAGATP